MENSTSHQDNPLLGIGYMMVGVLAFSIMDALAKWLVVDYSVWQILIFRGIIALFILVPLGVWRSGYSVLYSGRPVALFVRGGAGVGAMFLFFVSLRDLKLADATALGFSGAIFLTAFSVPLLKEHVGIRRWMAVLVGFIGVMVIVRPGSSAFQPAALLTLGAAVLYALMMIMTRKLAQTESSVTMVIYHSIVAAVVGVTTAPFFWTDPGWVDVGLLFAAAILGLTAQFFTTLAFRIAPVAVLAPFDYTALLMATVIGFVIWDEIPGNSVWVGATLLIGSGLYILYREVKLRRAVPT